MKSMFISIVGALTVFVSGAGAGDVFWNAATGDWDNDALWNTSVEPASDDYAKIDNGGVCTVSQAGEVASWVYAGSAGAKTGTLHVVSGDLALAGSLYLGSGSGARGSLLVDSGLLTIGNSLVMGASGASGHVLQTGGVVNVTLNLNNTNIGRGNGPESVYDLLGGAHTNKGAISIGYSLDSRATMNVANDAILSSGYLYVGHGANSRGTVIMKGTSQALNQGFGLGRNSGALGYVEIGGSAVLTVNTGSRETYIGEVAGGTGHLVITNNGSLVNRKLCYIGYVAGSTGTVDLAGGSLVMNNSSYKTLNVGWNGGNGTLNLRGGLLKANATTWGAMTVGCGTARGEGVVRGYGPVELYGQLDNSGRIIADGFGTQTDLDLSRFGTGTSESVTNSYDNIAGNGWFAVNKGRLLLPSIAVAANAGSVSYNWGESVGDADPDLVNSVRLTLSNASAGSLSGALLAADRGDVPETVDGKKEFVGVWAFTAGTFDAATLKIRYDDGAAQAAGIDESDLVCYKGDGSRWTPVDATVDSVAHTLTTTEPLTSLSLIAVGPHVPFMGTVIAIR